METRVKHVLIALSSLGVLAASYLASAQSAGTPPSTIDQPGVHSAVVDIPQVVSLPPMWPVAWETFWDHIPPSIQTGGRRELSPTAAPSRPNCCETHVGLVQLVDLAR
jgi:hypothetical protein